jgi:hypothetical protein
MSLVTVRDNVIGPSNKGVAGALVRITLITSLNGSNGPG